MNRKKISHSLHRLPSGNYRMIVDIGKDDNGKRIRKSVTASTEAEVMRKAFEIKENYKKPYREYTVKEALDLYIKSREGQNAIVTIYGYQNKARKRLTRIHNIKLCELQPVDIQLAVNDDALLGIGHKTLHDSYALVKAAAANLGIALPPMAKIAFPPKTVKKRILPTMEEMIGILKGSNVFLPAMLSLVCGGLRISEVRGIRYDDIITEGKNHYIQVQRTRVCVNGKDCAKDDTKNETSNRRVHLPDFMYNEIINTPHESETDYIIQESYRAIYGRYKRLMKKHGFNIRFHDLRAIYATHMKLLNIPKDIIMQQGGWANSKVLDKVYTVISDSEFDAHLAVFHDNINSYMIDSEKIQQ